MTTTETAASWTVPAARLILNASAAREHWLAARRQGIGGSDASTIAGLNPRSSLYALWLDKLGRARDRADTSAMDWGRRLEPVIAEWFTDTTGIPVRRAGLLASRAEPWQLVSVDRLAGDGGICEWKTTSWRTNDAEVWRDGDVPDHAEIQAQHGLAVTGRSHAHLVALIDGRDPIHRVVHRDDALIADLTALERSFWLDHVVADVEPPADGSGATTEALRQRYPSTDPNKVISAGPDTAELIDHLALERALVKAHEDQVTALENTLRALLGDAELLAVQGETRATLKQNGTFSEKRFTAEHPELAAALQREALVFDLPRLKAEHPELYTRYRARVLRIPKPQPVKET